jgi:hypothetical protein
VGRGTGVIDPDIIAVVDPRAPTTGTALVIRDTIPVAGWGTREVGQDRFPVVDPRAPTNRFPVMKPCALSIETGTVIQDVKPVVDNTPPTKKKMVRIK